MTIKNGSIYCEKCSKWSFSRVLAEHGRRPLQCPKCKRYDWEKKK